ncbi:MAG: hypothetical protein RLZZ67_551 [Candidatus Parcubacteria bacterium]|jgi:hypothetical protein
MTVITNSIMKKVRVIFLMRRLVTPFAFLSAAVVVLVSTVSVSHVIQNMPTLIDVHAVVKFFALAFAHTDVVVKSALVAGTLFLGFTFKGLIESIRVSVITQKYN